MAVGLSLAVSTQHTNMTDGQTPYDGVGHACAVYRAAKTVVSLSHQLMATSHIENTKTQKKSDNTFAAIANCHIVTHKYKKLSCRRETARRLVSLNILLSHPRSLQVIQNDTVE